MSKFIRQIFTAVLFLITLSCELNYPKSEYVLIVKRFEEWKSVQFKKGIYATEKNCNYDTVAKEGYKGSDMGIPMDIDFFYTDLNNDNKLDAIVTFFPQQCDGGNALMNAQIKVIVLSTSTTYIIDDTFIDKIENNLKKGWIHIESASSGTFFGTYFEYMDEDGRCCPSIKRPFTIDFKTKELSFTDNN